LRPALFSARRLPDGVHHRIVRCRRCRLVRSDPVLDPVAMAELHRASTFDYVDAVTPFQSLDHMPDPLALLRESLRILKPGGAILAFNHNVNAYSARVLRERSPIIDVEHTYPYSPSTMRTLFEAAGFLVDRAEPVSNACSAGYLLHLAPIPGNLKRAILARFKRSRLGRVQCTVALGNLSLLARRPG
ncbi:MAG: class I SAM-dependent methyltransferase, partial [Actinomycetota bacterium]|nr:class I SAM-dependent methyltransferase [Actinomycetota bacterium]